jgi:flagellin
MIWQTGIPAVGLLPALHALHKNQQLYNRALQRLATGSAPSNPAALFAGLELDASLHALDAESRSLTREASALAAKDGALESIGELTGRLESLAVRASDSTLSDAERQALELEADSIADAIRHTTQSASFAGERLFDDDFIHTLGVVDGQTEPSTHSLADVGDAANLLDNPDLVARIARAAAGDVSQLRADIGARIGNEITHRLDLVNEQMASLSLARSLILDTDYAQETAELARTGVLTAASLSLLGLRRDDTAIRLLIGEH